MSEVLDSRWTVEIDIKRGFICINDLKEKTALFAQGEDAKELIDKADELGATNDFIDWLYNNGYDNVFTKYDYDYLEERRNN